MSRFRGAWQSLNFDKEYLFGFETLVFATSGGLINAQSACNTPTGTCRGGGGGCLSTCPFAQSALLSRQFFFF